MKTSQQATRKKRSGVVGTGRLIARWPSCLLASLPSCLALMMCACATGRTGGADSLFGSKGAPWTIQCLELRGPYRLQQIEQVAETLKNTSGIRPKDVFVRGESDGSARLYYGTYFRRAYRKKGTQTLPVKIRRDLDIIRQLGDGSGKRYFAYAMPVRMPTPDVGNRAWALVNVPAKYSLQVAVFEPAGDFWQYKEAAVQYCALLRKKGHEAYYHHGTACSMVTVGAFGPDAVIVRPDGRTYYSSEVLALQGDKLLKHNLVNGAIHRVRIDDGGSVPVPSRLVKIPRARESDPW